MAGASTNRAKARLRPPASGSGARDSRASSAAPADPARHDAAEPSTRAAYKRSRDLKKTPRTGSLASRTKKKRDSKRRKTERSSSPAAVSSGLVLPADISDKKMCPICHDTYSAATFPVVHAPCGHVACASCSLTWQQKKVARTCALCRAPVLSIAHCPLLEQLFGIQAPTAVTETSTPTASVDVCAGNAEADAPESVLATRNDLKQRLQTLSHADLNNMPADSRVHVVKCVVDRALRKGDLAMLTRCVDQYKARASTKLMCDMAEVWKEAAKPLIDLLVRHGGRVNGHRDDRPLFCAISRANMPMISALLEAKADPTLATGEGGESALHIAVRYGRYAATRVLLDHGVAADIEDFQGLTPMVLAERGLRQHKALCHRRQCERCEARIQVKGELKWHLDKNGKSENSGSNVLEGAEDVVSEDSSTDGEDSSDPSVSDCAEMDEEGEEDYGALYEEGESEYDEGEEEEEEDEN